MISSGTRLDNISYKQPTEDEIQKIPGLSPDNNPKH